MPSSVKPEYYVPFLIAGMLLTGCSNSLLNKWQDNQCVENCDAKDASLQVHFEQPVWQSLTMFVGEFGCFLPVLFARLRSGPPRLEEDEEDDSVDKPAHLQGWQFLYLWVPAACDLCATTLMNVGLIYTPVSIYQMTRGALVLWVGLFSVMFLKRKLHLYQWLSLATVMAGVSIVGLSGSLIKQVVGETFAPTSRPPAEVFMGVLFVLFAQIFTAAQFVMEERLMSQFSVAPLVAVGAEGFFGIVSILIAMPFLALLKDRSDYFDLARGWRQITGNNIVLYSSFAIMLSIAMFNAFGLSVTRTLGIWVVSLYLGWEVLMWPFSALQVFGFGLLVYGTFLFNDLVTVPKFIRPAPIALGDEDPEEARALLVEHHLEETAVLPSNIGGPGLDVVPPPTR